jgi:hypothetical protein
VLLSAETICSASARGMMLARSTGWGLNDFWKGWPLSFV